MLHVRVANRAQVAAFLVYCLLQSKIRGYVVAYTHSIHSTVLLVAH